MSLLEDLSEDELIRQIRGGNTACFEILTKKYVGKIYGMALRMTHSPPDAEDILQEVFLLVFSKLDSFRGDSAFGTWLYKIALNAIYMRLRERKNAAEENIDPYLPQFDKRGMMQGRVRVVPIDPENETVRNQAIGALRDAVSRLPAEYRLVLIARDIDELSSEETAEALGLTVAAVKSRLHRARLFLRQQLEREFGNTRAGAKRVR